jgi:hypothetical protein
MLLQLQRPSIHAALACFAQSPLRAVDCAAHAASANF